MEAYTQHQNDWALGYTCAEGDQVLPYCVQNDLHDLTAWQETMRTPGSHCHNVFNA